jgi:hypothetical protein
VTKSTEIHDGQHAQNKRRRSWPQHAASARYAWQGLETDGPKVASCRGDRGNRVNKRTRERMKLWHERLSQGAPEGRKIG